MPYLTGDTVPVTRKCRTIHVPDDPAFMAAVSGQLIELLYPENWEKHGALTPAQMADAFRLAYYEFADSVCIEPGDFLYPETFNINPLSGVRVAGTTLSKVTNSSQMYNLMIELTAPAINNSIAWSFFCMGGHYDLHVLGARGTNYGRVAIKIDGGYADTEQDWYNATPANNIDYVYHVNVSSDGMHTLNLLSESKNAASSSYRFLVSSLYGIRTGA